MGSNHKGVLNSRSTRGVRYEESYSNFPVCFILYSHGARDRVYLKVDINRRGCHVCYDYRRSRRPSQGSYEPRSSCRNIDIGDPCHSHLFLIQKIIEKNDDLYPGQSEARYIIEIPVENLANQELGLGAQRPY